MSTVGEHLGLLDAHALGKKYRRLVFLWGHLFLKMLCIISTHIRFLTYCKLIFFSKMIKSRVHSFRKAHLLMPQYFHLSVRNVIKKRRLLSFESNISSWDCFKQRKGAFSIRRLHDFMTNVGVFDDILKIEHVLKWLMVFSKGAFSLKLCLRCKEHIPNPSDVFGSAFLVR